MGTVQLARRKTAGAAPGQQGRHRHAAAEALAQDHNVGAHAIQLLGQ